MVRSQPGLDAVRASLASRDIRLGELIGAGAAATVYEGQDEKHGRRVALKVLDPMTDPAVIGERFVREIGVAAGLRHPNIMPLYDSGEADGLRYYIMPFVTGESLKDRLTRSGPLPFDQAIRLGLEFREALGPFLGAAPKSVERPRRPPRRRARRFGPVIAAVVVVATLASWWRGTRGTLDPRRVVVAGFTNETGHPALDAFGDQIETWITDSLARVGKIEVITAAVDLPIRRLWSSNRLVAIVGGQVVRAVDSLFGPSTAPGP